MKKFKYVSALLAALGMCGVMGYAPDVWGQDSGEESDDALPPLVMVLFDTSASMNDGLETGRRYYNSDSSSTFAKDQYTLLTKAIAEIAGAPKVSVPGIRSGSGIWLPRSYKYCSGNACGYETKCVAMDHVISTLPTDTSSEAKCKSNKKTLYNDYYENGVIHSYMKSVKFGFGGFVYDGISSWKDYFYGYGLENISEVNSTDDSNWEYGVTIKKCYKKASTKENGTDCKYVSLSNGVGGIYSANPNSPAPLLYPTVSDDEDEIKKSNIAVLTSIRSYYAYANTPIGPGLADMYHMYNDPDPGLIAQPIKDYVGTNGTFNPGEGKEPLEGLIGTIDEMYGCRRKAVILVSDGVPNVGTTSSGYEGQSTRVWEDAERLFRSEHEVRVYPILYATGSGASLTSGIGYTMNMIAWKGGTCRDPDTGKTVMPDDKDTYDKLVKDNRPCFFNAHNSDALRTALVTALSDMLQGMKSKTAIATTTAIGQKENVVDGKWNNGYYNVYSGYNVTMGPVRDTVLQRTAIICDHSSGLFSIDSDQFLDISKRLKCRLRGSKSVGGIDDTGYGSDDTVIGCALPGSDYATNKEPEPLPGTVGENNCLGERYIFTANYKEKASEIGGRYAISTFDGGFDIMKNINISQDNREIAGFLPKVLNPGNTDESKAKDANFILRNNTADVTKTCEVELNKNINQYFTQANYILNPYECVEDFDCGVATASSSQKVCDLGRCIISDKFSGQMGCESNDKADDSKICIAGYWRSLGSACDTHSDCVGKCLEGQCVCHAGHCVPGTVKSCDIRQFLASVPLGSIEYAAPVPVAPPTKAYKSISYRNFSTRYWRRDTMLMVAANDGMLHAFVLGDNDEAGDYKSGPYNVSDGLAVDDEVKLVGHTGLPNALNHEGDELWAFIPKMSYKYLYNVVNFGDQEFLNGKPVVADVQLPGIQIDGDSWRTVIVGGFRGGGRGYYALDITNPAKPFVLWEIDHQWQPWKNNLHYPDVYDNSIVSIIDAQNNRDNLESGSGYPFQLLGNTYADPIITNLLIDDVVQPVAILAGGHSPNGDSDVDMIGKALYIVKLFPKSKEDLVVKIFYFENEITGTPEVYPNNFNMIAQKIYVGDSKGALYRLDVSKNFSMNGNMSRYNDDAIWGSNGPDGSRYTESHVSMKTPTNDKIDEFEFEHEKPIFDPNKMNGFGGEGYQAITFKPALSLLGYIDSVHPSIQITYGTGSNDNFSIPGDEKHFIASFVDVPDKLGNYQLNRQDAQCFEPTVFLFNSSEIADGEYSDELFGQQSYKIYTKDPINNQKFMTHQKMTGAAITHNFVSYFPTFVSNAGTDDKCASGYANIGKINARKSCSFIDSYGAPNENVQNVMNGDVFKERSFEQLAMGTRVYGLELTNQMYCIADCHDAKCNPGDEDCCQNRILAPQLIAQTGVETASFTPDEGSKKLLSGKVDVQSLAINLEAVKPEVSRVTWAGVYE